MSARAYDNIMDKCHLEDSFPLMLGLYMRLFYWFNKLRSWFCINFEDTKNRTLYMETKVLKIALLTSKDNAINVYTLRE